VAGPQTEIQDYVAATFQEDHMFRMKTSYRLTACCAAVLFGFGTIAAYGQSSTQGAIAGTVEDTSNAVIPAATITIHNNGTNAEQHLTADSKGYFDAPLLEPGTYTVTVAASGFGQFQANPVTVTVGQLTTLEPHLNVGAAQQTVVVSGETPALNFESPDMTATLPRTAIDNIPVQNRRWSALALTTPGVVADSSGFGLISVRGISTLLNNVEIDGADDNQAYYSEERGRTREGYSTSTNAVNEFVVNTGVYSAQYGRAAGGVINSVTKSGTNTMHGEAYFNDLDRGFGAYDPGSDGPTGLPLKPKDLRKIYGASLGGAILKNKLFWYYTYDQYAHINPGIARAKSYGSTTTPGSFLDEPTADQGANCNTTTGYLTGSTTSDPNYTLDSQVCTMAARLGESYATAVTSYDNELSGPAGLTSDLGLVPRVGYQEINTPKLDWQINSKNHASFLYHRLRWDAPGDVETNTSNEYGLDGWGTDFVKLDYGVAKLATQISSRLENEVLYQYSRELDDEGQLPYSAYTLNNLVAPGGVGSGGLVNGPGGTIPQIGLDTSIGFTLGSPYFSYRQALPDERKWQVDDILYYNVGNHTIRFGGDFLHNTDLIKQEPYYFGDYTYATIANYLTDLATKGSAGTCNSSEGVGTASASGVGTYGCYEYFTQDFGATTYQIATTDYAGFVQDNWKVRPRLTLELGLRYDYEAIPGPSADLTSAATNFTPYANLNNHPSDRNNFGPRLGFSLDVFGDGNTVLRGGAGMYYGRIINSTLESALFGSGSPNGQYASAQIDADASGAPTFPFPVASAGSSKPSSVYLAPNLQNPQVDEFDLQVQQQLGKGTVFQINYMGALGRELPNFLNVNLAPPEDTSTITIAAVPSGDKQGPLAAGSTYTVPTFGTCTASATCPYPTGYINPNFTDIVEYLSNVNSSYNGMTAEIQNRSIHGLQFDANYTWSHALDFNQNASTTISGTTNSWLNPYASARQNYGVSQFNVGNRFVGYVLYTFPNIQSGHALKYLTNGWSINDTFQMQNGLPYSAEVDTGKNSSTALNSGTWNGVNGVYYIPVIGLNTYQVPRATVDDLRLQKQFRFRGRYNLQLNADMYNVANHQNFSTTDINYDAYNFTPGTGAAGDTATMTFLPNTAPGVGFGSHSTSNDSGFLYTPREIQIQARLEF
jgi:outer membrane receptor protein involved in Fe transport